MLLDSSWEAFLKQSNGQEIVAADSVLLKQIKIIFSKMNSLSLSPLLSPFPSLLFFLPVPWLVHIVLSLSSLFFLFFFFNSVHSIISK